MDIGQAIRELRKSQGMTQPQLAMRCGMSVNSVCMLETGKHFPSKCTIEKLCRAFGIPQSYFMLSTIEESDIPKEKRVLYRALLKPLRDELISNGELDNPQ